MRILLLGGTGQIGWELRRTLGPLGEVRCPSREEVDLTNASGIDDAIAGTAVDLVVNAAAYTAVDRAEDEPERAREVNAHGPRRVARACVESGATLIHFSTDYVFSGREERPYRESDPADPVNVYGETKLAGERAIRESGCPHLILRTSWVYSARRSNFLRTMLRLFRERERVEVVDDQQGSPTWARMVAEATAAIVVGVRSDLDGLKAVYHCSAAGEATWFDFAREIECVASAAGLLEDAPLREIVPVRTEEFPTSAARPRWSLLDNERLDRDFGVSLPDWKCQLQLCIHSMAQQGQPAL